MTEKIVIEKIVHGGQGLGTLESGKKVFVWGGLPGETVLGRITKKKASFVEAVVEEVLVPSTERIKPAEPEIYLSTSPWQILDYNTENIWKQRILEDVFLSHDISVDWQPFYAPSERFGYRNKMEYNFWWDNDTSSIQLALHRRGSHMKIPVTQSILASQPINDLGKRLIKFLNHNKLEARALKSVILRSTLAGKAALCLYVVEESVAGLDWGGFPADHLKIFFSNPLSPASVGTELLFEKGGYLTEEILDQPYTFAPEGFFQVNIDPYEAALKDIRHHIQGSIPLIDMYSGVGTIGLSLDVQTIKLIEIDEASCMQAEQNARQHKGAEVIHASSETVLDYISPDVQLVVDPPRAGLHTAVIGKILHELPPKVIYLSCNPATQARDVALLSKSYTVMYARGYNFFPSTPHIESLLIMMRK